MKIKYLLLTGAVAVSMTFFAGCNSSSDTTSKDSLSDSSANAQDEEETTIGSLDAKELAEIEVLKALQGSPFLATHGDITNCSHLRSEEGDGYNYEFYGKWSRYDIYDDLSDYGKFRIVVEVSADGSKVSVKEKKKIED